MEHNHQAKIQAIKDRIEHAARRVGKTVADIHLVAVSKQKPITDIVMAYQAGLRDFGENRAEELAEKAQALSHLTDLRWHFIGHLQTRQSQPVAQYAHCFHALDRLKIAERLSSQLLAFGRDLPVFIQINASGEASKSGFMCDRWQDKPQQAEELLTAIKRIAALPKLQVVGLMTMAPFEATEAQLRATFQRMKGLSDYLTNHLPALSAQQLSMGMSNDFEIAIAAGATHVRIGSAIFGHRTQ